MLEEDLNPKEKLYLERRRNKATLRRWAERYGVPLETYLRWERGEIEGPNPKIFGLEPREQYMILRRRAGLTYKQMAEKLGISTRELQRTESGYRSLHRLIYYWRS